MKPWSPGSGCMHHPHPSVHTSMGSRRAYAMLRGSLEALKGELRLLPFFWAGLHVIIKGIVSTGQGPTDMSWARECKGSAMKTQSTATAAFRVYVLHMYGCSPGSHQPPLRSKPHRRHECLLCHGVWSWSAARKEWHPCKTGATGTARHACTSLQDGQAVPCMLQPGEARQ